MWCENCTYIICKFVFLRQTFAIPAIKNANDQLFHKIREHTGVFNSFTNERLNFPVHIIFFRTSNNIFIMKLFKFKKWNFKNANTILVKLKINLNKPLSCFNACPTLVYIKRFPLRGFILMLKRNEYILRWINGCLFNFSNFDITVLN